MSCKYNNCKHCGYKSECEIYKENANLEEKLSILLSCKNCSENKGGLLCQKEYEGKCLAQKIQYIKELEEENKELKEVHESDKRSLTLIAKKGAELELKIKKLTQHLEPQAMSALFEQVEEEVNQEQKIKELETKVKEWQALQEMFEGKSFKLEGEIANIHKENAELKRDKERLARAIEIIRNLLRVTYGEGWNYSLDVKVNAEQFLGELK